MRPSFSTSGDARADVRGDHAAGDVDGIRNQFPGQGQADGPGDRDAGLFLCFVRGRAQVRGDHNVVHLEERQVGAGFLDEDVDAGSGDFAGLQRGVEGFLVDEAAAGDVDDVRGALHLLEGLGAEHADGLRRLGHVDADEVGLRQQLVEGHQLHAELGGAGRGDVGVADVRGDHAAGDVDGVGNQFPCQGQADGLGDRDTGLFLRFVRGRAQVRGDHHVVELEERQVGAGLLDEDVDAGAGDFAGLQRGVERFLVDEAAAGDVDDVRGALHLLEGLGAEHADGLRRLGHVDADEVRLREQLVQGHQLHAELGGAGRGDVGIVGEDLGVEALQAGGDEGADPAQADDADLLLEEFDAGVLGALPLAVLERGAGLRDVAGEAQDVADGEFRGGDDVRGGGVHHHDTGLGGGLDVDVVEADACAGDHLEVLRGGDGLGVHLGGGADQDRVDVGDRREQLGTVRAVGLPDFKVRAKGVDRGGRKFLSEEYYRFGACHR